MFGRKELEEKILEEKLKGTSDVEIGKKYGVSFKYIEKVITKAKGVNISSLKRKSRIKSLHPKNFKEEKTTVWSFKQRGDWATHSGEYRGNWSPYIPRNVILKYSKPGDLVLDYFCGAGTTAIECKLLGRRCIAMDINDRAIEIAREKLNFDVNFLQLPINDLFERGEIEIYEPELRVGDARDLYFIPDSSIDLICSHPPYANIIHYTDNKEGDLSFLSVDDYLREMEKVAKESFRVLKPGKICAILIGDIRRKKHVIPLGFKVIDVYLKSGFKLRELVIKRQHNCKTTGFWYEKSIKHNFLLLAHEYLPIFEKPVVALTPTRISDTQAEYKTASPVLVPRTLRMGKLKKLETSTVWIFSDKNFDKYLNLNVIRRYSSKGYRIFDFVESGNGTTLREGKTVDLLFIKASFLNEFEILDLSEIEGYLKELKRAINSELPNLSEGAFLVIQTRDIRVGRYVEPLAKKVLDMITEEELMLKEIVIVTYENADKLIENDNSEFLENVHQYLLIYEVKR